MNKEKDIRIIGILRARNAEKYLPALLFQMAMFCNKILVLDDQSDDLTAEVAQRYGAEIRLNLGMVGHHEGRDRIRLHKWAGQHNPDWIFAPDADDLLEPGGPERIRSLVRGGDCSGMEAFQFPYLYMWGDMKHYRVDGSYKDITAAKLFKYFPDYLPMDREIHSMAMSPEIISRGHYCPVDIRLYHLGYMTPEQRLEKYNLYQNTFPEGSDGFKWSGGNGYEHILGRGAEIAEI